MSNDDTELNQAAPRLTFRMYSIDGQTMRISIATASGQQFRLSFHH
jgi:hypothetical protein